jgi:hypothetical protein
MKRQFSKTLQRIAALTLGVFVMLSHGAQAATNTGTGDIAGDGAALTNSSAFELLTSSPTLVKTAFLAGGGAALTDGGTVLPGTSVDFLIYLNNEADADILDVSIQDVLTGFTYTAGTIRVLNTTLSSVCVDPTACTAGEEVTIYDDVRAEVAKTDPAAGGDTASFVTDTVDIGDQVQTGNDTQNVSANTVLAVVFTVTVN